MIRKEGMYKRTIQKLIDEKKPFCGRETIIDLINRAQTLRDKALVAALFSTGSRASEVRTLKKEQFDFSDEWFIKVYGIPVLKRGCGKKSKTKTTFARNIDIAKHIKNEKGELVPDAIAKTLEDYVKTIPDDAYLFTSRKKRGAPITAVRIWQIVTSINSDFFPHRLRHEFCNYLVWKKKFTDSMLTSYIGWASRNMASKYVSYDEDSIRKQLLE
ncbi:MAG: tyrosine-type recombinase/integrase [Candidatus Bathyarchaeia archaeon]|jgi:integrase